MIWVAIFGGLGLAGLVALVVYGVWVRRQADDVMSEVAMVRKRVQELNTVLGQLQLPPSKRD